MVWLGFSAQLVLFFALVHPAARQQKCTVLPSPTRTQLQKDVLGRLVLSRDGVNPLSSWYRFIPSDVQEAEGERQAGSTTSAILVWNIYVIGSEAGLGSLFNNGATTAFNHPRGGQRTCLGTLSHKRSSFGKTPLVSAGLGGRRQPY
ncbi:uncharacterized protein P884DRAFT_67511 [Thermothelomyces heterothallicus CBS 202.75]|uniref:uncharacterized protein n=1 Tax=Thermothelomyces heterothallicus CBS 202.75 TaxID=1149848 RepID=UPI003744A769